MEQQQTIVDLQAKLDMYNHLDHAQDDIIHGRVQSLNEAMDDIRIALYDLDLCKYPK